MVPESRAGTVFLKVNPHDMALHGEDAWSGPSQLMSALAQMLRLRSA
jgi:hypothetical protein